MNFLKRIFGGKKDAAEGPVETLVRETLDGLIQKAQFELEFDLNSEVDDKGEAQVLIEMKGADEELLRDKEGQMIEALQLFVKRVLQHHMPDDRTNIVVDCKGYRQESSQALIELAEKLKGIALEKGKAVYFRAMPPKDRKVIHQHLAGDDRVKSRSIGEGIYKKIKIYPVKAGSNHAEESATDVE